MPESAANLGSVLSRLRLVILLVALAAALPAVASASAGSPMPRYDNALLAQINAFRTTHGLHTLRLSRQLDAAAAQHSQEMLRDGYFGHNSADGATPAQRIARFYPHGSYRYWVTGENLLFASPTVSAAMALHVWIGSAPHLRNLLDPRWRDIGISAVHSPSAPGVYEYRATTVITTDFGVRR